MVRSQVEGNLHGALNNRCHDLERIDMVLGDVESALGVRQDETLVAFDNPPSAFDSMQILAKLLDRVEKKSRNIARNVGVKSLGNSAEQTHDRPAGEVPSAGCKPQDRPVSLSRVLEVEKRLSSAIVFGHEEAKKVFAEMAEEIGNIRRDFLAMQEAKPKTAKAKPKPKKAA